MNFLLLDLSLLDRPQHISKADTYQSYENWEETNYNWLSEYHPIRSWHSYAAAMKGRFICASPINNWQEHAKWADLILCTWNYNPDIAKQTISALRKMDKKVIGAFHENTSFFQHNAKNLQWLKSYRDCANACDAHLAYPHSNTFPDILRGMGVTVPIIDIPTPYHTAMRTEFLIEPSLRKGIFIGPCKKEFELEKRNWLLNVLTAINAIKTEGIFPKITTINLDPTITNEQVREQLSSINKDIEWNILGKQDYHSFLHILASHEQSINIDSSHTQGQADGDSLFVGVPLTKVIGGHTTDFADKYFSFLDTHGYSNTPENVDRFADTYLSFNNCIAKLQHFYETA